MSTWKSALATSAAAVVAVGLGVVPAGSASAADPAAGYTYHPTVGTIYAPTAAELAQVNKGNSVLYPKSAQLDSGRIVAAFERSIGDPVGQTIPVYKSDDYGTTWQALTDVPAPADLSDDPAYARYTSNWTNPYLYVLPERVGDLAEGTLLMATLVSGDDGYYRDQKTADPSWLPTSDGDRQDLAIALFASGDEGASWDVVNITGTGGWSADYGRKFASGNAHHQQDPVWEPYLMVHDGQLVAYYTDENDWESFDPDTGVLTERADNLTGTQPAAGLNPGDTGGQILLHKTWDGTASTTWSAPVLDVYGAFTPGVGFTGRPGMTNVVPTTDGKWILTSEFGVWKVSDDPLRFWDVPSTPQPFHNNAGSPVVITVPHPTDPARWSLVFNNGSSGNDVYVNASGRSDGQWLRYKTPIGNGYSRNLQYVEQTGRLLVLRGTWGGSPITHTEVDLGSSQGAYYTLVNRKTGQVIGTGGKTNDAAYSGDVADVVAETAGATPADTQLWHVVTKADGSVTFLNRSGGRAIGLWQGSATAGTRLTQWVDEDATDKRWTLVDAGDGYVTLQSAKGPALYATAAAPGAAVTLQTASASDPQSQQWQLVVQAPTGTDLAARPRAAGLVPADEVLTGTSVRLDASSATTPAGALLHAGATGTVFAVGADAATAVDLGTVTFDDSAAADVTVPSALAAGDYRLAVLFEGLPLLWDSVAVRSATDPGLTGEVTATFDVDPAAGGLSLQLTDDAVDLGTAQLTPGIDSLVAEGRLPQVRVTDTRTTGAGWVLAGVSSAFRSDAGADSQATLGWTPAVVSASAGQTVTAGPAVESSDGLGGGATLAAAPAGHGRGTADLDAALRVQTPATTGPGAYVGTITLTLA